MFKHIIKNRRLDKYPIRVYNNKNKIPPIGILSERFILWKMQIIIIIITSVKNAVTKIRLEAKKAQKL